MNYTYILTLREGCSNTEFFLVRIFLYSVSPNRGKNGPEKTPYLDTFHTVWILKISFFQNFHQQEKFWNHLLDSTLRKAVKKSPYHVYLIRPDWKNLHIKAGQKSSRLVFYPVPALVYTAWKVSKYGVFLVRIFLYSDCIRRFTEEISVFGPNVGKYGPENLRIWTLFTQW